MSEPRFSDKVERTQKAGLANPDKDVSLYIRSPGSSDREKFGRIVGRKLILPDESNCAGYVFTHEEWMDAVKIGKHYHLRIEETDFHNVITAIAQSIKKTRRVAKRFSEFIRSGFKIKRKRTKEQQELVDLRKQLVDEKKNTERLARQLAQWQGTVADLSTVGYGDRTNPPTDLHAVSFLRKIFDSVAVYLETNEEGVEYLMIDLLEGNFSSHGRPAAWTKSQKDAKEAMDWGNVRIRLLSMHENGVDSRSPYYKQDWDILFDLHIENS
jgi:hypothetical protein